MNRIVFLVLIVNCTSLVSSQTTIPLYTGSIPNSKPGINKNSQPSITVFLPAEEKANGIAVLVCPGGGYSSVVIKKEGDDIAKMLVDWGITAFVLKYRLPNDTSMYQKEIGPLQDAQRAIQLIRLRAKEWNIDPGKVGVMGFSAGGHLASTLGTRFKKALIPNKERVNLRPDFMVLAYPVISLTDSLAHAGSRMRLLGSNPTRKMIKHFSTELHVTKNTPPAFLVHAKDDDKVKVENSIIFYNALVKKRVPAEMYLYEKGSHGFAINNTTSSDKWTDKLKVWISNL